MRVLHIQKSSGIGGSERHLLSLLPGLRRRGADVGICLLGTGHFHRFVEPLEAAGIRTEVLRAGPQVNPLLFPQLTRAIRRFGPDLVHTQGPHAQIYGQPASSRAGVPAVSSFHSAHERFQRPPVGGILRAAGRLPRRTIAISRHVEGYLAGAGFARPEQLRVVHYGIEAGDWDMDRAHRTAAREHLGLTEDDVAVGVAARLVPGKGHSFLIDALARAHREAPSLRLMVAGRGPLREELEAHAGRALAAGRATFCGHVDDMHDFIGACDVLAFPTLPELSEGFGLAALEAMAAQRPVVATRVGALPEIVEDGATGNLVTPGAVDELAARLASLAGDKPLRRSLGEAGRRRCIQEFGIDHMLDRTEAVYSEALEAGA